ncbi:TRAP transporter small permease subunit [Arenibacter sp. M-2]|uniref:TRAP transporter small permease n=1 Tax=unclassified Arenibacter TaxID=2615047 RepID=UPI000D77136A|nr:MULTISPECIES: TRAP transporter small permease subunit [unclassified Arenibacter]MDL5513338.1 TRAP transporter small permease subunit [Arenibacter sp. M-2]PXX30449.1 TRAP-type C4-dicarboxylate transport system permease small subunit [Arenibacter sp. ARW7G5Y1]|tara:strand:+ start:422 stop:889 length:468 start_codon:yes stop_codon:yes gene_type:complete
MLFNKMIGRILKIGTLLSTWGLIFTVLLQIICRFTPFNTPHWTEEASRIFFIYAMSFASGLAMKNEFYVHLDMFYNRLPERIKKILNITVPTMSLILFVVMAIYAIKFVILGIPEKSPSMGFNMGIAFFGMFIMSASISYYLLRKVMKIIKNTRP